MKNSLLFTACSVVLSFIFLPLSVSADTVEDLSVLIESIQRAEGTSSELEVQTDRVAKCVYQDHTGCEWTTKDFGDFKITGCWPTNSPVQIKHTHPYVPGEGYCGKSHNRGFCRKVKDGECELIQTSESCWTDTSK